MKTTLLLATDLATPKLLRAAQRFIQPNRPPFRIQHQQLTYTQKWIQQQRTRSL